MRNESSLYTKEDTSKDVRCHKQNKNRLQKDVVFV